jgi:hypothetical protein
MDIINCYRKLFSFDPIELAASSVRKYWLSFFMLFMHLGRDYVARIEMWMLHVKESYDKAYNVNKRHPLKNQIVTSKLRYSFVFFEC